MIFNLGYPKFMRFKNMVKEIKKDDCDWNMVAFHMMDSKWYNQVGKRSKRLVKEIIIGD